MRKIQIESWKSRDKDGNEHDENLLMAINVLIANKRPEEIPRGLDKFRLFNRLMKSFDRAEKTKELVLEEFDYKFLKDILEKDIPSTWGANDNICKAVELFVSAKED